MRTSAIIFTVGAVALALILTGTSTTLAYDKYTDSQCAMCHSGFVGKGALHDTHTAITNTCTMCHPSNPGSKPVSTWEASDGTAFSCLGCHGRDYGSTTSRQAAGLRLHHANSGISICAVCHPSDPVPLAETVAPPHYARGDVNVTDSCSDGLDNDGDLFTDSGDSDCQVAVETTTWSRIKAMYK